MNLLHSEVALPWAVAGWLVLLPPALRALNGTRGAAALHGSQQHLWLAGVVVLAWLWTLQVRVADGVAFGLLGAAFYALVFGRHWARLGLLAAVALHTTMAGGNWATFGINGLLLAVVPTALAGSLQRQIERRLPKNIFVFIIGNGLFVTLTVTAVTSVLLLSVGWLMTPATAGREQLAYALLLAWGEALASGMLFSSLVIFGPHLVLTYRQDLYLPPRQRP
jgi:uncharacterized membrane protein